LDMRTETGQD